MLKAMERHLYRDYGPLLLSPAYRDARRRDRLPHALRAGLARERRALHARRAVGGAGRVQARARAEQAWKLYQLFCPVHARDGARPLPGRALRHARQRGRARLAALRPRRLDLVHRLRRRGCSASAPSGCWACGPTYDGLLRRAPACRRDWKGFTHEAHASAAPTYHIDGAVARGDRRA